jgi:hypothetical protein
MKNVWVIYVGYGVIALQMLGVMKKQNVRALNSHKPRNLIQKSNDIFKVHLTSILFIISFLRTSEII